MVIGSRPAGRLGFEFLEKPVQILNVKNQADPLRDADQARTPFIIEGPPLDANVCHGLRVGQAAPGCWV